MRRRFSFLTIAVFWAALAHANEPGCEVRSNPDVVRNLSHFIFVEKYILPTSNYGPELLKMVKSDGEKLKITGFPEAKDLVIEWSSNSKAPEIVSTTSARVLKIPKDLDFSTLPDSGKELLRHFFMGHPLQPYSSLPEGYPLAGPAFTLKPAQLEGVKAVQGAVARGDRTFLYVAPTGLGKTEVFMAALKSRIERENGNKLHLVLVDQIQIADQLAHSVGKLKTSKPIRIVEWGGSNKSIPIEELVTNVEKSSEPTVLVTTIQSLKARVKGNPDANQAALRSVLDTILFDEVHHAGAEEAQGLIQGLVHHEDSRAFFYGTTATPKHRDVPLIETLFGSKAFWAKLDRADDYLSHAGTLERNFDEVFSQLSLSIQHAELSPLSLVDFTDPADIQKSGPPIFIRASDQLKARYVLNPDAIPAVVERIQPAIERNKSGFVSVATIEEAQKIAEALGQKMPSKKFEPFHSQMPKELQESILAKFRKGEIQYLVTVKKLDEGVNIPAMSLYIDLNRSAGMRQILQRIGRVVRLHLGKEGAEVFAFFEVNGDEMLEKREFIERLQKGELQEQFGKGKGAQVSDSVALEAQEKRKELLQKILGYEKSTPAAVRSQQRMREAANEVLDFYIENDGKLPRANTPSEAGPYAKMHLYKANPDFLAALEDLPELREKVEALTPHKERISLGKRGPKPAAELTEQFVKQNGRLPKTGDKREEAILRWIKNYYSDPEYRAGISPEIQAILDTDPRFNLALRDPSAPRRGRKPKAAAEPLPDLELQRGSPPIEEQAPLVAPLPEPAPTDERTKASIQKSIERNKRKTEKERQIQERREAKALATPVPIPKPVESAAPMVQRSPVNFFARAEDEWKRLPESAKAAVNKRALTKILASPQTAGILADWGKSTTKTRSVLVMDKNTEYRVIYVIKDSKPIIVMIGSKDDVLRSLSTRLNGLK